MLGYPIRKEIRDKLDSLRSDLSRMTRDSKKIYSPREKSQKDKYQESVIQTPYIFMASAPIFEEDEEKRLDPEVTPRGTIILGNQEGYGNTPFKFGLDLYNARGFQTYRPNAGVKSLTSEYLSSNNVQFVRHITVNWTCFSLTDLDVLGERFLTLGRKVYVEWGRTKDEKTRPTLLDKDGNVNVTDLKLSETDLKNMSEATRLREKVLSIGKGNFDAVVGFINNFNFSSREDGGFDCTTEITIQGVNALDGPTDVSNSNQDDGEKKPKEKFIENTDAPLSEINFQNALTNLPNSAKSICDSEPVQTEVVFKNYTTADNYFPPLPAEYEGYYKAWREGVIGYNKLQEAFVNAVNSNEDSQLLIGSTTNINKFILDWFRGATGTTTEELQKEIDEGYIAPAYFENAKQKNQEILVDRDKNFILTYNFGVKDDKLTTDDMRTADTNDVGDYFRKYQSDKKEGKLGTGAKALYTGLSEYEEIDPEKSWVRWGWFEDNILNRYFAILEEDSGEKVSYFRSITENKSVDIKSHKHFRTTDISKFIFPGKFEIDKGFIDENGNVVSMKKTNEQRIQKRKEDILGKINDLDKTKDEAEAQEKVLRNQIKQIEENKKLADSLQNQTIEDIQKELSTNWHNDDLTERMRQENLDLIEKGYEPYLYLKALDKKVKEFKEFSNFDSDSGKLRNIMINMKHLQDVFSNKSATLGENMNTLFESLANESGGLIDLVIGADNREDDGRLVIQERGFDAAEAKRIEQLESNPGLIYEFPVWQNDSYVITQELASDISSENYKILLSKAYDERIQLEKKKGISLVHQAQISQISPTTSPENSRYKSIAGVKPAFQIPGFQNYGQKIGDETKDLEGDGAPDLTNAFETAEAQGGIIENNRKEQLEKDLEQRNNIFSETDIAYTAEGKLKSFLNKNMRQEIKFKTIERKDKKTGRRYIAKIPNVDDYGMVGITNTLTLRGIAGIIPSNLFTTTYLPRKFKESCHFYATEVNQSIDSNTWTTSITGRMTWKYIHETSPVLEGAYNRLSKTTFKLGVNTDKFIPTYTNSTVNRITETTLDRISRENK